MATGTVIFFNHDRGFGFIKPDDGGDDVFVHAVAVQDSSLARLEEGQKLTFEVNTDARTGKSFAMNIQST